MPAACLIVRVFAVAVAGQPLDCSALFFFFAFVFVLGAESVLGRRAAESACWEVYASCLLLLVDTITHCNWYGRRNVRVRWQCGIRSIRTSGEVHWTHWE